jgi:cyanate permease
MIALLLMGFGIVALIQIPSLIKKQWRRELICFTVLWSIGLVLSILVAVGITLPPISTIINHYITEMFGL